MTVARYELRSAAELDALARAPLPLGIRGGEPRRTTHRDLYLDTPDDALRARGIVCRLRVGASGAAPAVAAHRGTRFRRIGRGARSLGRSRRGHGARHRRPAATARAGRSGGARGAHGVRGGARHAPRTARPAGTSVRRAPLRPRHREARRRLADAVPALRAPPPWRRRGLSSTGGRAGTRARPRRSRERSARAGRAPAPLDASRAGAAALCEHGRVVADRRRDGTAGDAHPRAESPRLPAPRARDRRGSADAASRAAAVHRDRHEQSRRVPHGAHSRAPAGRRGPLRRGARARHRRAHGRRPPRPCRARDRLDRGGAVALRRRLPACREKHSARRCSAGATSRPRSSRRCARAAETRSIPRSRRSR